MTGKEMTGKEMTGKEMTGRVTLTLKDMLSMQEVEVSCKALSLAESGEGMAYLKDKIAQDFRGIQWPVVYSGMAEGLSSLLEVPLSKILVESWNKYRVLAQYRDRTKYPPEKISFVALGKHTIKSEHKPSLLVQVLVNEASVLEREIKFNVIVSLTIEGLVLKIQDARIKGIEAGEAKGSGTVTCEGAVIIERSIQTVKLPGSIDLGSGVPIGP